MAENTPETDAPKKKLPIKTIIVVFAALLIEAGAIVGIFMFATGPSPVQADGMSDEAALTGEQPTEVLVVSDKFQNTRTGRAYLYDTEVWIVVKSKFEEEIEQRKEGMQAAIKSDVTTIFRRAEPAHLRESELATLTRQIQAALDKRFGYDPEGNPYVQECFLAEFKEFPAG